DTRRAHFVFETRLPTRYYIPPEDVRMELLVPSEKTSACPYKGRARYWSAKIGGRDYPDIVWFYPEPIPECPKIRGLLSFFNEQVDAILVDGIEVPRPVTPWSKDWKEKAACPSAAAVTSVIPGSPEGRGPEVHEHRPLEYGFRARRCAAPR